MNLELKGEEKSGFHNRQHKMNRNFPKEEEHNKGKKKKIKNKKKANHCQLGGSEKYDHALQDAIPESGARAFHQVKKVLHQNRKSSKHSWKTYLNNFAQLFSKNIQRRACRLHM